MTTRLYDIPSDIFKDIVACLEDEDLGALYLTGDTVVIRSLRTCITKTQYRREMFIDFPNITTIENVWGDGKLLPPNLTTISTFVPFDDNCMDAIPSSVTSLGTSCDNGTAFLDSIPKTVTTLKLTELIVGTDKYTFSDNLKHIEIDKITDGAGGSITLPKHIETIRICSSDSMPRIYTQSRKFLTCVDIPWYNQCKELPNLITLRCENLCDRVQLSASLETLVVRNCLYWQEHQYIQISELKNLQYLHLRPIPADMMKYIPKTVKRLEINVILPDEHTISLHEGLARLSLVSSLNAMLILPSTLTLLRCDESDFRHLRSSSLPNLKILTINEVRIVSRNFISVENYDFTLHPKLQSLTVNKCIDLRTLPDSILELSCAAVLSGGAIPKRLQKLVITRSCKPTIDNIKSKLPHCLIAVKNMCNIQNVGTLFKFFGLDHLLDNSDVLFTAKEVAVLSDGAPNEKELIMILKFGVDIYVIINLLPAEMKTPDIIKTITDKIEQVRQGAD